MASGWSVAVEVDGVAAIDSGLAGCCCELARLVSGLAAGSGLGWAVWLELGSAMGRLAESVVICSGASTVKCGCLGSSGSAALGLDAVLVSEAGDWRVNTRR